MIGICQQYDVRRRKPSVWYWEVMLDSFKISGWHKRIFLFPEIECTWKTIRVEFLKGWGFFKNMSEILKNGKEMFLCKSSETVLQGTCKIF